MWPEKVIIGTERIIVKTLPEVRGKIKPANNMLEWMERVSEDELWIDENWCAPRFHSESELLNGAPKLKVNQIIDDSGG